MPRTWAACSTPLRWVARSRHCSPVGGKDLVGPPAEQEGVGALVDLVQERRGLVVEARQSASAALESAAAVLIRPRRAPASLRRRRPAWWSSASWSRFPAGWVDHCSLRLDRRTEVITCATGSALS